MLPMCSKLTINTTSSRREYLPSHLGKLERDRVMAECTPSFYGWRDKCRGNEIEKYIPNYQDLKAYKGLQKLQELFFYENDDKLTTYHSASSIPIFVGFSTMAKPLTTTKRTRFSSCITNSGNFDLVSNEVASSLLLNIQVPTSHVEHQHDIVSKTSNGINFASSKR